MKILVPTDFSALSFAAAGYAAALSVKLKAEMVLLNVVYVNNPPRSFAAFKEKSVEDILTENSKEDIARQVAKIQASHKGLKLVSKIIKGYPVEDVIENFAAANKVDLIVMGTKGASGLKKYVLGSNAAAVISASSTPVISVPGFAKFKGLKKIVLATDMFGLYSEIKTLIALAKLFGSLLHIIHVMPPDRAKRRELEDLTKQLISQSKYRKISFSAVLNRNVREGIEECIAEEKPDLLAMFTGEHTFLKKLFGQSLTRHMSFDAWTPLLTIRRES